MARRSPPGGPEAAFRACRRPKPAAAGLIAFGLLGRAVPFNAAEARGEGRPELVALFKVLSFWGGEGVRSPSVWPGVGAAQGLNSSPPLSL